MNVPDMPPNNPIAEAQVLASFFTPCEMAADHLAGCEAYLPDGSYFYSPARGNVYDAIRAIIRRGQRVDTAAVAVELGEQGHHGDDGIIAALEAHEGAVVSDIWNVYAPMVRACAVRRRAIRMAAELERAARDLSTEVQEAVDGFTAAGRVLATMNAQAARSNMADVEAARAALLKVAETQKIDGITSGHADFDMATLGFRRGGLSVWASGSGVGKTHFLWGLMDCIETHGINTGMVQGEMSGEDLITRQVVGAGAHRSALAGGPIDGALARLDSYSQRVQSRDRIIMPDSMDLETVLGIVSRLATVDGCQFVVVDYVQMVSVRGQRDSNEASRQVYDGFKRAARQLNIHIALLSQFTVATNREKSPYDITRYDIYGGMQCVGYADLICAIVRPVVAGDGKLAKAMLEAIRVPYGDKTNAMTLIHITKDRFGGSSAWAAWLSTEWGLEPMDAAEDSQRLANALAHGSKNGRVKGA